MRISLFVVSLMLWSAGQATTITFDDMPTGDYNPSFTTPQGYQVASTGFGFLDVTESSLGGNYLFVNGPTWFPFVTLTHSAGQSFTLQQMDLHFYGDYFNGVMQYYSTDVLIQAEDEFGGLIAEMSVDHTLGLGWRTVNFDSSWTGITALKLSGSVTDYAYEQTGGYDNIVVSTVPVPSAIWLFGSALAGMGWMRRKQAA
jgi:hypothetical protein